MELEANKVENNGVKRKTSSLKGTMD